MKTTRLATAFAAALFLAGTSGASTKGTVSGPQDDAAIAAKIRHEILTYPRYSIWDAVNFRVVNGHVELSGAVSQPFKKADIGRIVSRVPGITGVDDRIDVLPLSPHDDRVRIAVARAIYGDPVLSQYGLRANPAIHIVVRDGRVTLEGAVQNEMDKNIAGLRAAGAGLSFGPVVNNLRVDNPPAKKS